MGGVRGPSVSVTWTLKVCCTLQCSGNLQHQVVVLCFLLLLPARCSSAVSGVYWFTAATADVPTTNTETQSAAATAIATKPCSLTPVGVEVAVLCGESCTATMTKAAACSTITNTAAVN